MPHAVPRDHVFIESKTFSLNYKILGKKKKKIPEQEEVKFWVKPDKEGWLYSQGDYVRNWRRRWFVMKDGYLFRFLNSQVDETTKPRGVVDLSQITDVGEGKQATGRPNSIKLSTPSTYICYICDSETECVEWMSALETQVNKIIRLVAGLEEEEKKQTQPKPQPKSQPKPQQPKPQKKSFDPDNEDDWNKLLAKTYEEQTINGVPQESKGGSAKKPPTNANYNEYYSGSSFYPSVDTKLDFSQIQGLNRKPSYEATPPSQASYGFQQQQSLPNGPEMQQYGHDQSNYFASVPSLQGTPTFNTQYDQHYQQSVPQSGAPQQFGGQQMPYGGQQQQFGAQQPIYQQQQQTQGYGQMQGQEYSIIDQNPPQTWQKAFTGEGKVYYYNLQTGQSQWEPPY